MNPLYLSLIPSFIKSFKIRWEKNVPDTISGLGCKGGGGGSALHAVPGAFADCCR